MKFGNRFKSGYLVGRLVSSVAFWSRMTPVVVASLFAELADFMADRDAWKAKACALSDELALLRQAVDPAVLREAAAIVARREGN